MVIPQTELMIDTLYSGDGLIHELVNGILAPLKSSESPLPTLILGVIPAGTGNAIATTLSITTPAQAAFRIITARSIIPLKVTSVHIGPAVADAKGIKWTDSTADVEIPPVVKYSVVVVSWGLHAQIVRQSESLRALGNQRFRVLPFFRLDMPAHELATDVMPFPLQIAAMKQLALNQQYPGKLYLQDGELLELSPLSSSPAEATFCPLTPDSNSSQTLFTSSNGPNTSTTKFSYFVSTKVSDFCSPSRICRNPPRHPFHSSCSFCANQVSSLELGFKIAPHAHPSNPTTDLILCTSPDRSQVLDLLKGAGQNGNHTTLPFVKYVRAKGYTLLPTGGGRVKTDGMVEWVSSLVGSGGGRVVHDLCIDGEMVEVEDGKAVWISVVEGRLGDVFRVFA
ncbi:hypothetical protein HK097_008484 [Rhizophlyctis rosea]|uniref:DAGKc domain-containing protein n=1 Tax=Rhizophlyctis rosea TaxID=64517 RepID=A0AAD5SJJ4_9FUNG|nr:hypothetical protein HK097_008484 [Rhizophlyctis rosea]